MQSHHEGGGRRTVGLNKHRITLSMSHVKPEVNSELFELKTQFNLHRIHNLT